MFADDHCCDCDKMNINASVTKFTSSHQAPCLQGYFGHFTLASELVRTSRTDSVTSLLWRRGLRIGHSANLGKPRPWKTATTFFSQFPYCILGARGQYLAYGPVNVTDDPKSLCTSWKLGFTLPNRCSASLDSTEDTVFP